MSVRNYSCKDVDMLLASKTIAQSLISNITDLSSVRVNWTSDFADTLVSKIDDVIENYLGLDKKKQLREATARIAAIQAPVMRNLSFFKKQIKVDFGEDATEILKQLGYYKDWGKVQNGNQQSLIQLLYLFKTNMTETLKASIVEKGTNPELIEGLIVYANELLEANVLQETMKETSKALSEDAVDAMNEIYDEIRGVCKIAAGFYQYEPIKKEQFTFSKIVAQMSASRKITQQDIDE